MTTLFCKTFLVFLTLFTLTNTRYILSSQINDDNITSDHQCDDLTDINPPLFESENISSTLSCRDILTLVDKNVHNDNQSICFDCYDALLQLSGNINNSAIEPHHGETKLKLLGSSTPSLSCGEVYSILACQQCRFSQMKKMNRFHTISMPVLTVPDDIDTQLDTIDNNNLLDDNLQNHHDFGSQSGPSDVPPISLTSRPVEIKTRSFTLSKFSPQIRPQLSKTMKTIQSLHRFQTNAIHVDDCHFETH